MISFSYRISFSKILTKNYVFHVYFKGNYSHKAGNLKRMQITTPDELLCTVYELCARTHFHYIPLELHPMTHGFFIMVSLHHKNNTLALIRTVSNIFEFLNPYHCYFYRLSSDNDVCK